MNADWFRAENEQDIPSPGLLLISERIDANLRLMIEIAGDPARLRPHVKTHKLGPIVQRQLALGITKYKCATIAEAEMLATCGVPDVLIAYPMVGPNCGRLARLAAKYPQTRFGATIDHPVPLLALSQAVAAAGQTVDAYLDINCGMNRTGIVPGDSAVALYQQISRSPGLRGAGFHVYDGHNSQEALADRTKAVETLLAPVLKMRGELERGGFPVSTLVMGGTPTFPIHAKHDIPGVECSPGTLSLHDYNYGNRYPEIGITPAALLLTRVISRPSDGLMTLDLGYKAVSPDQPAGKRCVLLNVPEYEAVLQNEEHFVVRSPHAQDFTPGDVVYAMPAHVCPTVALHRQALVVENGQVVDRWDIVARDRELST